MYISYNCIQVKHAPLYCTCFATKQMSVTYMIGPLISDDRCICIPIVVSPAQLDSCGVFGVGGAGIWNYSNMFNKH